jgi:hypothetical protein
MHPDDVAWMTYAELAARLGTKPDSAARLAARKRWPRQRGNDGRARVAVPAGALPEAPLPPDSAPDHAPDHAPDSAPDDAPDRDALNQTIGRLEAERDAANSALAECRLALAEARERAEREAERAAGLAAEAATAVVLRETVEALKAALEAERERGGEFRRERDRARLPLLRQLWLALAGGSA